jgi:hypothetical protein
MNVVLMTGHTLRPVVGIAPDILWRILCEDCPLFRGFDYLASQLLFDDLMVRGGRGQLEMLNSK